MTFHVGQKVVCVDDYFAPSAVIPGTILPKKGDVYTVRELFPYWGWAAIRLHEIHNPPGTYRDEGTGELVEAAFPAFRFRPVIERKTDISVFTAMLKPSRVRA
jgi:hypothetical protein